MKLSLSTEWLFFHLWKKNPDTNSSCPGVFLADTIIYRWAQPYFWYFTTKEGQILRKTKERIFVNHINEVFLRGLSQTGVIAIYMQNQEKKSSIKISQEQEKIEFEYFQDENFKNFLQQREKSLNALLQKFIEPKNAHNSMIKVSWSPQFCLLSRKTNINDLKNVKVPLEERLMTFEGPEHFSVSDSISSPILSSDIEQICLNIVKHIQDVSGGNIQISRMILYFKIDEKNRLWLLFSSGIKVRQKFINEELIVEEEKKRNKYSKHERIMSPVLVLAQRQTSTLKQNFQNRVKVNQGYVSTKLIDQEGSLVTNQQQLYKIAVSQIITSYDQDILDEESKLIRAKLDAVKAVVRRTTQDNFAAYQEENEDDYYVEESRNIPGLILKIWGRMDRVKYHLLRQNPSWLKINMNVCMECFLKFTLTHVESATEREVQQVRDAIRKRSLRTYQMISQQVSKLDAKMSPQMSLMSPSLMKSPKNQKSLSRRTSITNNPPLEEVIIKLSKFRPKLSFFQEAAIPPNNRKSTEGSQTQRVYGTLANLNVLVSVKTPSTHEQANRIYRNKQGLKSLPRLNSTGLNSTSSTINRTVIQSIQSLTHNYRKELEDLELLSEA